MLSTILKVIQQQNLFYQFFESSLRDQLKSAGELLLFRETNTPTAKLLQRYLMTHGKKYLKQIILPLIQKAAKKQKCYEVNLKKPIYFIKIHDFNSYFKR